MIAFRRLPGSAVARPLLDVYLDDRRTIPQACLLDTGAAGVRLSARMARAAGIALPDEPTAPDLLIGGIRSQAYRLRHELAIDHDGRLIEWTAEVTFCEPWPHPFGLLGLVGFFDAFDVWIEGRDRRFGLTRRC